ncbi:MAG: metal-dependent hydrolase [Haloquadratum sp.]
MFVGHEFLAFALAAGGAVALGWEDATSLRIGAVAALAALLPDLDVVYAVATYAVAVAEGTPLGWEAFWGVANGVHRVVTHPLPVGLVGTAVFGTAVLAAVAVDDVRLRRRALAAGAALVSIAGVGVVVGAFRADRGVAAAVVAVAFLACIAGFGALVGRRRDLPPAASTAAVAVGLLSHPFGDVFLAAPPPLLAPFGPRVLADRVVLATDPTLNLLAILFVEVGVVWAGVAAFWRVRPAGFDPGQRDWRRLGDAVDRRAALGAAYVPLAFFLPRPTIADAHVLGFTIVPLAVAVGVWVGVTSSAESDRTTGALSGFVAGLGALSVGAAGYALAYLFSYPLLSVA